MINFCKIVLHHVELLVRRSLLIHPPSLMIVSPGVRGHKHGHVCDRTLHLNMVYTFQNDKYRACTTYCWHTVCRFDNGMVTIVTGGPILLREVDKMSFSLIKILEDLRTTHGKKAMYVHFSEEKTPVKRQRPSILTVQRMTRPREFCWKCQSLAYQLSH